MEGKQRSTGKLRAPGTELVRIRLPSPPATSPRRARRRPVTGILVVIEAPTLSAQHWIADAFDISSDGMGLVLPPALPLATELLLSFRLDEEHAFSRVPAEIRHRDPVAGGGGVRFGAWPEEDRRRLLEHLATH